MYDLYCRGIFIILSLLAGTSGITEKIYADNPQGLEQHLYDNLNNSGWNDGYDVRIMENHCVRYFQVKRMSENEQIAIRNAQNGEVAQNGHIEIETCGAAVLRNGENTKITFHHIDYRNQSVDLLRCDCYSNDMFSHKWLGKDVFYITEVRLNLNTTNQEELVYNFTHWKYFQFSNTSEGIVVDACWVIEANYLI